MTVTAQKSLPEMENDLIDEIYNTAIALADAQRNKKDAAENEKLLQETLLTAMKECGLEVYHHGPVFVVRSSKEKCAVVVREGVGSDE